MVVATHDACQRMRDQVINCAIAARHMVRSLCRMTVDPTVLDMAQRIDARLRLMEEGLTRRWIMISPTGKGPRKWDKHGSGAYGAPRGGRAHKGVDYVCVPGQVVVSPIAGTVTREARPYAEGPWSGVVIESPNISVMLFYLAPDPAVIGRVVAQGAPIGTAQDITEKYPGITPHVHLQVEGVDPQLLMDH